MLERGLVFTPSSITRIRYGVGTVKLLVRGRWPWLTAAPTLSSPDPAARVVSLSALPSRAAVQPCPCVHRLACGGRARAVRLVAHETQKRGLVAQGRASGARVWGQPGCGAGEAHPSDASIARTQSALASWELSQENT